MKQKKGHISVTVNFAMTCANTAREILLKSTTTAVKGEEPIGDEVGPKARHLSIGQYITWREPLESQAVTEATSQQSVMSLVRTD